MTTSSLTGVARLFAALVIYPVRTTYKEIVDAHC